MDFAQMAFLLAFVVLDILSERRYPRHQASEPGRFWVFTLRHPALGAITLTMLVATLGLMLPGAVLLFGQAAHGRLWRLSIGILVLAVATGYGVHLFRAYQARRERGYLLLRAASLMCWCASMSMLYAD